MKTIIVLFGITGDLSQRKLVPALESIHLHIPHPFELIGISRRDVSPDDVVGKDSNIRDATSIVTMDLADQEDYKRLWQERVEGQDARVLVYLAVPPHNMELIVTNLSRAGFGAPNVQVLIEKPFGFDEQSSQKLFGMVESFFDEERLYFVDHYLGKRVARAIVDFRRKTSILAQMWNKSSIERIDVIAAESLSVEGRTAFYEQTGALRDFLQGHLMQLLSMIVGSTFDADVPLALAKSRALGYLSAAPTDSVRGQYNGYRAEASNPDSQAETFAELTLFSSDPAWQGIPMRIVTGKNLESKQTSVTVYFRQTEQHSAGKLSFDIQPEIGVTAEFDSHDGLGGQLVDAADCYTIDDKAWNGYEAILVDALDENRTFFATEAEIIASWRAIDGVLKAWATGVPKLVEYQPGDSVETVLGRAKRLE
ncbi:MAG: hypothetical protein ABI397_00480 [Candidatus Saccharimonas sp.]